MCICEIVQEEGNTDDNTYVVDHKRKITDADNNISGEELENIYRSILLDSNYVLGLRKKNVFFMQFFHNC